MNVRVGHAQKFPFSSLLRLLSLLRIESFQDDDQRDVILHQSVQGFFFGAAGTDETFCQRQRGFVKLHLVFLNQREFILLEENRASVDDVLPFRENLRRLLLIHGRIPVFRQFALEKVFEVVRLYLLQT